MLTLLSLLQAHRTWTGPELADRLGVTTRTVRNDVERLRELGYPVDGRPGVAGGYRLRAGRDLPPLLLDDDEAVALVVGLRTAAGGTVSGIDEASVRAMAKLQHVLPSRLRRRVSAIEAATLPVPSDGPKVDPDVLAGLADACRDHEQMRFDYRGHDGTSTVRHTEPHRMVQTGRRWYLVAWDVDRADWRTFRVDRIRPRVPTGPRFQPRALPADDLAAYVTRGIDTAPWRYRARVTVHAAASVVAARLPSSIEITPVDDQTCVVAVGSDTPHLLAVYLGMLDVDFEVHEPPETRGLPPAGRRSLPAGHCRRSRLTEPACAGGSPCWARDELDGMGRRAEASLAMVVGCRAGSCLSGRATVAGGLSDQ